ncbi:MAG TPA: YceI family protein [Acidimicrobiales bacterium]|nr:YceI family protein [Acidimicrobiales bacterium]
MSTPPLARRPPSRRRQAPRRPIGRTYPLKWVAVALALTAVLLIGGPYLFFDVIDGSAPSRLHLPPASDVPAGPPQPGPVTGTWVASAGSLAGYRVDEILFGQTHTAVGRTARVHGGLAISGTVVTAADFTVDLASVHSDQGSRDAQFRGFIMDTADHPTASFRLTSPIQLGTVPAVGQVVTEAATGDLDLRGVRRPITFTLQAERLSATTLDVNAEIPIRFSDWHIPDPSFAVARLGRTGTLEVLLQLVPAQVH